MTLNKGIVVTMAKICHHFIKMFVGTHLVMSCEISAGFPIAVLATAGVYYTYSTHPIYRKSDLTKSMINCTVMVSQSAS